MNNNKAGINGGAMYFKDCLIESKISDSFFFNNTASLSGGALYFDNANFYL